MQVWILYVRIFIWVLEIFYFLILHRKKYTTGKIIIIISSTMKSFCCRPCWLKKCIKYLSSPTCTKIHYHLFVKDFIIVSLNRYIWYTRTLNIFSLRQLCNILCIIRHSNISPIKIDFSHSFSKKIHIKRTLV